MELSSRQDTILCYMLTNIDEKAKAYAMSRLDKSDWMKIKDMMILNKDIVDKMAKEGYPVVMNEQKTLVSVSPSAQAKYDQHYYGYIEKYIFDEKDLLKEVE